MRKLLLVDGYSIMYRAYFALAGRASLSSPDGTPTGVMEGFFSSLFSVVDEYIPTDICVCFDVHSPTFRHEISSDYKATRKPMPDEMRVQIPLVKKLLDLMGICRIEKAGFEADDLIGTVSRIYSENGDKVYIYTGDHDDYQLLDDNVSIIEPKKGMKPPRILVTKETFEHEHNVSPFSFIYVKALMGDNSDNIKGINKVGEKTAFSLVEKYQTIEGVYSHLDEIKGALHTNLEGQEDLLATGLRLCTIDRFVELDINIDAMSYSVTRTQELYDELNRLALNKLIRKLGMTSMKPSSTNIDFDEADESTKQIESEIREVIDSIQIVNTEEVSIVLDSIRSAYDLLDTNEKQLPFYSIVFTSNAVLVAIVGIKNVYQISFDHLELLVNKLSSLGIVNLPASISYKTSSKVMSDCISKLRSVFDVEVCAYVLNTISGSNSTFENIYTRTMSLNYPYKEDDNSNRQMSLFDEENIDVLKEHAVRAYLCIYVARKQATLIVKNKIEDLVYKIEFPLIITLDKIERNGMFVSSAILENLHASFSERLSELQERIYELTGESFLISSPKQLSNVLFDKLGLKHGKLGKNGYYSTSAEVLNSLIHDHPCISPLIEYRKISKLDSTYALSLRDKIDEDGRIRTTFTQVMTNTGRLSSTEPNLQNIPIRSVEGEKIRSAFVAPPGRVLVDADYSQIELRLLAHLSGDEAMVAAFNSNEDIHRRTASRIYGVDVNEVDSNMRSRAKTVNFSILYGVSEYGLAQDLNISYQEAKELIASYNEQFPSVMNYLNSLKSSGNELGYVKTMFGRQRILNELSSQSRNIREFGLRAAMNTPIQGTAADIIKIAMNRVNYALEMKYPDAKLVMQVHDELIVECSEEDAKGCSELLKAEMESAVKLKVKLEADCNIGKSWLEAK